MGMLADIIEDVAAGIARVAISGAGMLARIGLRIVADIVPRIQNAYQAAKEEFHRQKEARTQEALEEINNELAWLQKRKHERGSLTSDELGRARKLVREREILMGTLQKKDEARIVAEMNENQDEYAAVTINDDDLHIIQGSVGQTFYGKKCPRCGMPMRLQWHLGNQVSIAGIAWACTGWYWPGNGMAHRCSHWEEVSMEDRDIFARAKRPEFEDLTSTQFEQLVTNHTSLVVRRFGDVLHERSRVEAYRCPVHGEELVLREKRAHHGRLMDRYFLGCPRWLPDGTGCPYIVKLKSAAQLHFYLEAATGEGVI
jgi:predicted RNA-binding Zn-ribbon protein involved in translation (DUF1610 family)